MTPVSAPSPDRKPWAWRWQHLIALAALIVAATYTTFTIATRDRSPEPDPPTTSISISNVYSGAVGSLEFVLPRPAQLLRVTVGFLEDSAGLRHRVKFEIVGDGRFLLDERTVEFGETAELRADLTGRSRVQPEDL